MHGDKVRDSIYDALVDDDAFDRLPLLLAGAFGARSVLMYWQCGAGPGVVLAHSRYFTDAQLADYAARYAAIDPWLAAGERHVAPNLAADLTRLVPVPEFERSRFYQSYVRAMGDDTAQCMGMQLADNGGGGMIAFQRGAAQPGFDPGQIVRLQGYATDLRRLLTIRGRLASCAVKSQQVTAMLDALPEAALLVAADGLLLHANAAGEALIRSPGALGFRAGRIAAAGAGDDLLLQERIAAACRPADPQAGAVLLGGPAGAILTITPCRAAAGRPAALLLARLPRRDGLRDNARLRSLFGLSPVEAEVARLLTEGLSPAEISCRRQVGLETIRSQIKAILAKCACRRQSELAALLAPLL